MGLFPTELQNDWRELAKKSMEKKGFNVVVATRELQFLELLKEDKWDVVWIAGCRRTYDQFSQEEFTNAIIKFHRSGKGLFILGDNDPYFVHCNMILPSLVGCSLIGNTTGNKTMKFGSVKTIGEFDQEHLIFAGINNLFEGVTICYPNVVSKLIPIAMSTDGNPCILCCERGNSNYEDGGRIVVDSGWTKLYHSYWASAGQARYVVNATVWLVDLEGRHGMDVKDFS